MQPAGNNLQITCVTCVTLFDHLCDSHLHAQRTELMQVRLIQLKLGSICYYNINCAMVYKE